MRKKLPLMISFMLGIFTGASVVGNIINNELVDRQKSENRYFAKMILLKQWLTMRQSGKSVEDYLKYNNYHTIAIYGMGFLGECLLNELWNSGIEVKYAIDRNADNIASDIEIKKTDDFLPDVDAVIVTALYGYADIKRELKKIVRCPVISLEELVRFK